MDWWKIWAEKDKWPNLSGLFKENLMKMSLKCWRPLNYIFLAYRSLSVTKFFGGKLKIVHFETIFQLIAQICLSPPPTFWGQSDLFSFPPISDSSNLY